MYFLRMVRLFFCQNKDIISSIFYGNFVIQPDLENNENLKLGIVNLVYLRSR